MAQILVRHLDESVVNRLKERAARGGRSLQAEAKMVLEDATRLDMVAARALAESIRNELAGRGGTDSTELLREIREA